MAGIASGIGWGLAGLGTLGQISAAQDYAKSQREMLTQMQGTEAVGLELRQRDRKRKLEQMMGQQAAIYGASGVTLEGTPAAVLANTASEVAKEDFTDKYNSEAKQQSWELSKNAVQRNADTRSIASLFNFGANALIRG
jgi:hypothetical protein